MLDGHRTLLTHSGPGKSDSAVNMAKRGALIVLEGLDRSGKTTQAARLVEALNSRGVSAVNMSFPDRTTPIGTVIDTYLKSGNELDDAAVHLLFSANRWEASKAMKEKLKSGTSIVLDRYAFSGVAFTAAKGTLSIDWCKGPDRGLPKPDVVIYLNVSPEVAKQRGGYGGERYENPEFQEKVRENFDTLRFEDGGLWEMVDGDRSADEVASIVSEIACQKAAQVQLMPLADNLWEQPAGGMGGGGGFADFGFGRTAS